MAQLTLGQWDRLMSAGETTFAVRPLCTPHGVFATHAEAEQAAALLDGKFIQWDGPTGHQLTIDSPDFQLEPEAGS
jgi:hypothetical protein